MDRVDRKMLKFYYWYAWAIFVFLVFLVMLGGCGASASSSSTGVGPVDYTVVRVPVDNGRTVTCLESKRDSTGVSCNWEAYNALDK